MITSFQRIIHRHGRWIFLVLLGIILVAFVMMDYWGVSSGFRQDSVRSQRVYGRKVDARELDLTKRRVYLNFSLSSGREIRPTERIDAWVENQALQRIALLEKARRLGIVSTDKEVVAEARQFFLNQKGEYDSSAYAQFASEWLPSRRLSEADFEILMHGNVILRKLMALIASTAKITPQQVTTFTGEVLEKLTVSACQFELNEYLSEVKPNEPELRNFYRQYPNRFRTPEKVRIAYAVFPIRASKIAVTDQELKAAYEANRKMFTTADGKVKSLKEVAESLRKDLAHQKAMQETMRQATEFTIQMVSEEGKPPPAFDVLAKKNGVEVKQTAFFGSNELAPGISIPEFTAAAFKMSAENPISDPIPSQNAVYVLQFLEKQASSLPPFEQVKEAVKNAFIAETALKLARENGEKKRQELMSLLRSGKSFEQVVAILKLRPKTFKGFNAAGASSTDPYEGNVQRISFQIPTGSLSDFIPNAAGGFFVYVHSRQGPKSDEISMWEPQIRRALLQTQQQHVLQDFQQAVLDEAGIKSRQLESNVE